MVYLASLAPTGRRSMAAKLRQVARLPAHDDILTVPWERLRFGHVAVLRTRLQELNYSPATANSILYARRGVARAAFNLELVGSDDLQRIRDVGPIRSERLPVGLSHPASWPP